MQPPPPCRSACSQQKEHAGGSPDATCLNPLIREHIPFEVAFPCLPLVCDPLGEAFAPARENTYWQRCLCRCRVGKQWLFLRRQRLSGGAAILKAAISALQSQIPFAQPEGGGSCFMARSPHPFGFLFKGSPPPAQSLMVLESDWGYVSLFI